MKKCIAFALVGNEMIIANLALRTSSYPTISYPTYHLIPNVALCTSTGRMVRLQLYGWEEKTSKILINIFEIKKCIFLKLTVCNIQ